MPVIEGLNAREILDSRGRPTVLGTCKFRGQEPCQASVPSGTSKGHAEAHELRDGDPNRYGGLGCKQAVTNIRDTLNRAFAGKDFSAQSDVDRSLIEIDGTPDKSLMGANAILAISLAFARCSAAAASLPLWRYFATLTNMEPTSLPRLTINLFSGGKHAGAQVSIQDVLLVPSSARSIDESLAMTYDVYQAAAAMSLEQYGMRLLRADEGGLAPPFNSSEEMIEAALTSIKRAGYIPGKDFALAIDVAASHFFSAGTYSLDGEALHSGAMIHRLQRWVHEYPIVSVEDGLAEDDWENWPALKRAISPTALALGDDLLCTNPTRIRRAIDAAAANALLLKLNQVGTLTEAAEAYQLARSAGWNVSISVRSGETEDNWAADLVVGWRGDQFKSGSITQSERLAKYNRLLEIEADLNSPMTRWPSPSSNG
jgi:enolase